MARVAVLLVAALLLAQAVPAQYIWPANVEEPCDAGETIKKKSGSWTYECSANPLLECSRTLTAGAGLTGGGTLCADRTLDVGQGTCTTVVADAVSLATSCAQDQTWTGSHDFGGGKLELPNSTTLPGSCTVGQLYHDTDASAGARLNLCRATDTWLAVDDTGAAPFVDYVFSWSAHYTGGALQPLTIAGSQTDAAVLAFGFDGSSAYPSGMSDRVCVEASCSALCTGTSTLELHDLDGGNDLESIGVPADGVVDIYCSDSAFSNVPTGNARMRLRHTQAAGSCLCSIYAAYWTRWK